MSKVHSFLAALGLVVLSQQAIAAEVLTESQMDSVVAGAVSDLSGKYFGFVRGDDTGRFKFVVKKSGVINGFIKFEDGGRVKVKGSVGDDGTFGAVLLGQRKNWGIGGIWGTIRPDLVFGNWSRPNHKEGTFIGRP